MPSSAALSIDVLPTLGDVVLRAPVLDAPGALAPTVGRGSDDGVDLRLAQLLCARVCHDLIGAAGAIETGVGLLAEKGADRADICDLIALSGRQLNRRLAFYRLAFGMTGSAGDTRPLAEAKRLAEGFLDGGRVSLCWQVGGASMEEGKIGSGETRILLCAILVAAEGLHRGGSLSVRLERATAGTVLTVAGEGRDAAIADAARAALSGETALDAVSARTVPAYYLGQQIRALGAALEVEQVGSGFSLRIAVPDA